MSTTRQFKILLRPLMLAAAALLVLTAHASAVTVTGEAVSGVAGAGVGNVRAPNVNGNTLGVPAIEYFIPLSGGSGTFGAGPSSCAGGRGTCSDVGNGSSTSTMTMWLKFSNAGFGTGTLTVLFQDLDLINVNDPTRFLESLNVLREDGTSLTGGFITDISSALVDGDANSQTLLIAGILLDDDPLYLQLQFRACQRNNVGTNCDGRDGRNTAEFLHAEISTSPVPLPPAVLLFGTALVGMGILGRRRKKAGVARA